MKKFFAVTNESKDLNLSFTHEAIDYLTSIGMECTGSLSINENQEGNYIHANSNMVSSDTEFILVFGGDGTFIHVGKDLNALNIPIIGINLGKLGFLTEINPDDYKEDLKHILNDQIHIESRMILEASVIRDGKEISNVLAFNDIVLTKTKTKGVIDFDVNVNDRFLNSYSSDGIIISTPTGSTGYNLSAGGPVVYPIAEIILATPICAHSLNSRTIVFSADAVIDLIAKNRNKNNESEMIASFDGENDVLLNDGDIIRCKKSTATVKVLRLNNISFIEHLGKKMR